MRVTVAVAAVIAEFLRTPDTPRYGYDLTEATGLPSGLLYPLLRRMQHTGWLTAHPENIDPKTAGRPIRIFYHLTEQGRSEGRTALDNLRRLAIIDTDQASPTEPRPAMKGPS